MQCAEKECDCETSPCPHDAGEESLSRRLTWASLTLMGIGACVGSGIFVIVGKAAQDPSTGPAVCFSFMFASLACITTGLSYAELASRYPVSGSAYLYSAIAFGELPAVICGINLLVDYHVGAGLIAISFANYLGSALSLTFAGLHGVHLPSQVVGPAVILLLTFVHCRGVSHGAGLNAALVTTNMAVLWLIIVVGIGHVDQENLTPVAPHGWNNVAVSTSTVMFSFVGFDSVCNAAEECKYPQRDIPIGIILTLLLCGALYTTLAWVLCGICPYMELDPSAPLVTAFGPSYANVP